MSDTGPPPRTHRAGAFDVRDVIAGLIGSWGVVLVLVGSFGDSPDDRVRTGDGNAHLWAGVAVPVSAAAFALWPRLRPVVVDLGAEVSGDDDRPTGH